MAHSYFSDVAIVNHHLKAGLVGIGLTAAIGVGVVLSPHSNLYPNPNLTPGLIATQAFKELTSTSPCGTYSQCHRATPQSVKDAVAKEYGQVKCAEVDHFVPLALGGADDIKNLWCQSNDPTWGYKVKDKLESYLVIQMKAGVVAPKDAQTCILTDWIQCYKKYFSSPNFGSVDSNVVDPDN